MELKSIDTIEELQKQFSKDLQRKVYLNFSHHIESRAALEELLLKQQLPLQAAELKFPHKFLSYSHSKNSAMAVYCAESLEDGVGLDIEKNDTQIQDKALRLFFHDSEMKKIRDASITLNDTDKLAVWVIKEALFKADLNNSERILAHYILNSFRDSVGGAQCVLDKRNYLYACYRWKGFFVALAVPENTKN